jgi:hypothetical protein
MMESLPLSGGGPAGGPPGSTTSGDLRSVLAELDTNERSGIVVAKTEDGNTTRIHLRRGTVVAVEQSTNAGGWILAEYLLRTQSITSARLVKARKQAEKTGQALDEVLVETKVVGADLLKRLIDLEAEEALMPLFRAIGLTVYFVEERPIPSVLGSPLPVGYVLKEGERQRGRWAGIRRKVGRPDAIYRHDGPFAATVLGYEEEDGDESPLELSADARLVYFFLNGERTTEQIARTCALSLFQTMSAMEELLEAYLVSLVTTHGDGEALRETSSFLPRLVWLVTSLAIVAVLALLGDGLRTATMPTSEPVIPSPLEQASAQSRLSEANEGVRLYELRFGEFPPSLEALDEAGLRHPARLVGEASLEYKSFERGFRLRLAKPSL